MNTARAVAPRPIIVGTAAAAVLVTWLATDALAEDPPPPSTIELDCIVRDFRPSPDSHPDFDDPHINGPYAGYVQLELDEHHKPVYSPGTGHRVHREWRDSENRKISWCLPPQPGDNPGTFGARSDGAVQSSETFGQWFRDVPGVNLPTLWKMKLTLQTQGPDAGSYVFETNDFNPLYPIDGNLFGNGPDEHNFYFTVEIKATFVYDADGEQFMRFKGDDDTWVFIDDKLVMDHGGITGSREYYVEFDRLGLTDGEVYELRFFHAERKQPQSQFHLWTNVELQTGGVPTLSSVFD
jgi:fibro-slime domain-containing protein